MADLIHLASRCETAEVPNYELEREIHRAIGRSVPSGFEAFYEGTRVPTYTVSIDAALQLVPDGHNWLVRNDEKGAFANVSRVDASNVATVRIPGDPRPEEEVRRAALALHGHFHVEAASPALALSTAALRARAASEGA